MAHTHGVPGGGLPTPAEIAEALVRDGLFTITVEALPTQRLVDIQLAAYKAGPLAGVKVSVMVEWPEHRYARDVTIRVTARPGEATRSAG